MHLQTRVLRCFVSNLSNSNSTRINISKGSISEYTNTITKVFWETNVVTDLRVFCGGMSKCLSFFLGDNAKSILLFRFGEDNLISIKPYKVCQRTNEGEV